MRCCSLMKRHWGQCSTGCARQISRRTSVLRGGQYATHRTTVCCFNTRARPSSIRHDAQGTVLDQGGTPARSHHTPRGTHHGTVALYYLPGINAVDKQSCHTNDPRNNERKCS